MGYNPLKEYRVLKRRLLLLERKARDKEQERILKRIEKNVEKLKECATAHPITGYRSIHHRNEDVEHIKKRKYNQKFDFFVAVIDIDDFGKFNKKYGMHIGDRVLTAVTKIIEEGIREYDLLIRGYHLHGEEMQVILQAPNLDAAFITIKRLQKAIDEQSQVRAGYHVTATFGLTKWDLNREEFDAAAQRADRIMQRGKGKKKNSVYSG